MEINGFKVAKDYLDEVNRIFEKRQAPEMRAAMKYCNMALEKQIPKAPDMSHCDLWHCPTCGQAYIYSKYQHDYCQKCGQAIKWD